MRKSIALALVICTVFAVLLFGAAAPVEEYTYKAILPDTPLYADSDLGADILIRIPQDAAVEIEGDPVMVGDVEWQRVSYTSLDGYVVKSALYRSLKNDSYDVVIAKASAQKMGEDIYLYDTHLEGAPVAATLNDGEKLRIIDNGIDYDGYLYVEYDGGYYFVRSEYVTTGLSYNETLAVIIAASFVGAVIIAAVIVFAVRKRKRG